MNLENYLKIVEYYFINEYSDLSISDCINNVSKVQNKPKKYWINKINKIATVYSSLGKSPANCAGFIASLFKARLKTLISN